MQALLLTSWNVNGIRACYEKGFIDWLNKSKSDICLIQETKAQKEQLKDEILNPENYLSYWFSAKKKGYSSVGCYIKKTLGKLEIINGIGAAEFDDEGRTQIVVIDKTMIINCYFPNSRHDLSRLDYKLDFDNALLKYADDQVEKGMNVIICGDYNVAHKPIDLKNPDSNIKNPGFLPEERKWMSKFLDSGYIDTFRHFYPDLKDQYTWWSYRFNARKNNTGWRIDYFCVNKDFIGNVVESKILSDVLGSDHCPVFLKIKI